MNKIFLIMARPDVLVDRKMSVQFPGCVIVMSHDSEIRIKYIKSDYSEVSGKVLQFISGVQNGTYMSSVLPMRSTLP